MFLVMLLAFALGMVQAQEQPKDPLVGITPDDVAQGKRLFQNNCAPCHGIDGSGGAGPALTRPKFARAPDNEALVELIAGGIPDRGMPPSWHLGLTGPKQVAAYVRTLGKIQETPVTGNATHGRAVFQKSGCGACHIVNGQGSGLGPELTDIGLRRTAAALGKAVTQADTAIPEGFVMVAVQPKDGPEVRGMRVNEDSFTIQVKDGSGRYHSFRKPDVVKVEKEPGKTFMPSYASSLSGTELDDLVAYLASLRGAE
jgi:putative heme-binding domain-containing protein